MRYAVTIVLLASCLAVLGCNTAETFATPSPRTEAAGNTTPTLNESTTNKTDKKQAGSEKSAKERLRAYLSMRPSFKASYRTKTTYQNKRKTGVETVVIDGSKSKRSYGNETLYILNDDVYLCRQGTCYTIPQEQPPKPVNTSLPPNASVTVHSQRRIAGVDSTCFTVKYRGGTILDCRGHESGVLTRYEKDTSRYSFEMRATSVEAVPDGAFDLPSEPKPVEQMPRRTKQGQRQRR